MSLISSIILGLNMALIALPTALVIGFGGWGARFLPILLSLVVVIALRVTKGAPVLPLRVLKKPAVFLLVTYMVIAIVTLLWAKFRNLGIDDLNRRVWFAIVPMYIFAFAPRTPQDVLRALYVAVAVITPMAFDGARLALTTRFRDYYCLRDIGPLVGEFCSKNIVGDLCGVMAIICLSVFISRRNPWWRAGSLAGLTIGLLGLASTHSRAAIIGTAVAFFVMPVLARVRMRYLVAMVLIVPTVLIGSFFMLPEESRMRATLEDSIGGRVETVGYVTHYISNHLMAPIGVGQPLILDNKKISDFVNVGLQDMLQLGILGLLAFAGWMISCLWMCIRNANLLPSNSPAAAINNCAFGIMCLYFVHAGMDAFWTQMADRTMTFVAAGIAIFVSMIVDGNIARMKQAAESTAELTVPGTE
jgi:hypothetical protein